MIIDTISIISCIIITVLLVVSVVANPFFRKTDKADDFDTPNSVNDSDMPRITVLVLANNNAQALDANLSIILTQDYAPGYEVIVVGEKGDLPTEAVVEQYAHRGHLYATYIPHRSLFMSKSKLAVALGVKAAHNEWIVMVNAECRPQSDVWLKTLASRMDSDANLVMGYSNYDSEARGYYRFARLRTMCYMLRRAVGSVAYRTNGTNIAFRRSEFIAQEGYRGNLQLVNGEYDFIINKYAQPGQTRVVTAEDAWIREDSPTSKQWHDRDICYAHIRKFLSRSTAPRTLFNFDMTMMYANYAALVASIVLSAVSQRWILLAVAALYLVLTIVLRSLIARKVYVKFGEEIPAWRTVFYELSIVWRQLSTKIRYSRADQYDFTTHKL
ncbi:glycosyltransferase [uncultured Prevotella sp.]|uniref:glycosyltransferase n=1 Tax=uncultured Prevotella sp. TaxID=159272 RepID=UPI0026373139|nr:glycosyltransferase [uncultured Prevotella sp.]MEE1385269.1 glycosyltransferase [Prevotella sp.]